MKTLFLTAAFGVIMMGACNNNPAVTATSETTGDSTATDTPSTPAPAVTDNVTVTAVDTPMIKQDKTGSATSAVSNATKISAQTVVYKTKADYSKNVPVLLSADKREIVAYPAPKDVYYNGKLAYPTTLKDGYLLDNRGIGANSAFLSLTYEEYSKLETVPKLTELYAGIKDKDPFVEIYNLGDRNRFKDETAEINSIIAKGGLKKFTRVK